MSPAFQEYLFTYHFDGRSWGISIFARSPNEAREKIKAVGMARYDGVKIAEVPMGPKPIARAFARVMNWAFNQ